MSPKFQSVHLDYRVNPKPKLTTGNPTFSALYEIIDGNRALYKENLADFLLYKDKFWAIRDSKEETDDNKIAWNNGFLPGLDIVGIYGMIAKYKPSRYIEIGSGNSTKVARKSVAENGLHTEIVSIDPCPRANIDHLADKVVREPFENMPDNRFIVESLAENDILFIDNSHRIFPNSDATTCFLELLPFLKKGVVVHFHDIFFHTIILNLCATGSIASNICLRHSCWQILKGIGQYCRITLLAKTKNCRKPYPRSGSTRI